MKGNGRGERVGTAIVRGLSTHRLECFAGLVLVLGVTVPILAISSRYAPPHDELWNLQGAWTLLGRWPAQPAWGVRLLGHDLPLVSGPYQGAIKSYPLAGWIAVFGTSPFSLRMFNAGLGVLLGVSCWWAVRPFVRTGTAVLCILVPLLVADYAFSIPSDFGPILLGSMFLVVGAGCLGRSWSTDRRRWLIGAAFFVSAMAADKLTTAPIAAVGVLAIALVIVLKRTVYLRARTVIQTLIAGLLPLLPHLIYFLREGTAELRLFTTVPGPEPRFLDSLQANIDLLTTSIFSTRTPFLPTVLTSRVIEGIPDIGHFVVLSVLVVAVVAVGRMICHRCFHAASAFLLWPVGAFFLFPFFSGLSRPYHFLPLVPLTLIGVITVIDRSWPRSSVSASRIARIYLTVTVAAAVLVMLGSSIAIFRHVRVSGGRNLASPALYDIADKLEGLGRGNLVCLDYSVCVPLRAALGTGFDVRADLSFSPRDESLAPTARDLATVPGGLIILRVVDHEESALSAAAPDSWVDWLNAGTADFLRYLDGHPAEFAIIADVSANGTR